MSLSSSNITTQDHTPTDPTESRSSADINPQSSLASKSDINSEFIDDQNDRKQNLDHPDSCEEIDLSSAPSDRSAHSSSSTASSPLAINTSAQSLQTRPQGRPYSQEMIVRFVHCSSLESAYRSQERRGDHLTNVAQFNTSDRYVEGIPAFNTINEALKEFYNLEKFLLVKVIRSSARNRKRELYSSSSSGSICRMETIVPPDICSAEFVKRNVVYPRYKAYMKIIVLDYPKNENPKQVLYADPVTYHYDSVHGNLPGDDTKIIKNFEDSPTLISQYAAKAQQQRDNSMRPVVPMAGGVGHWQNMNGMPPADEYGRRMRHADMNSAVHEYISPGQPNMQWTPGFVGYPTLAPPGHIPPMAPAAHGAPSGMAAPHAAPPYHPGYVPYPGHEYNYLHPENVPGRAGYPDGSSAKPGYYMPPQAYSEYIPDRYPQYFMPQRYQAKAAPAVPAAQAASSGWYYQYGVPMQQMGQANHSSGPQASAQPMVTIPRQTADGLKESDPMRSRSARYPKAGDASSEIGQQPAGECEHRRLDEANPPPSASATQAEFLTPSGSSKGNEMPAELVTENPTQQGRLPSIGSLINKP
ncbi:hypothetical protein CANCADRAFT_45123 [Tortispora caseinolytica NRRL Y-17796]|uniref:Uncharacterized protein n=1 Tax=Tortispora caseinolytica NRRL Y-17796 TaxID=767744 RepID=A0A1E4TA35_9ASCO|nr:hypothetical protein CANCADRAFT_45123 [Tortispora caseinolytica NRRL Y-17796]